MYRLRTENISTALEIKILLSGLQVFKKPLKHTHKNVILLIKLHSPYRYNCPKEVQIR